MRIRRGRYYAATAPRQRMSDPRGYLPISPDLSGVTLLFAPIVVRISAYPAQPDEAIDDDCKPAPG